MIHRCGVPTAYFSLEMEVIQRHTHLPEHAFIFLSPPGSKENEGETSETQPPLAAPFLMKASSQSDCPSPALEVELGELLGAAKGMA